MVATTPCKGWNRSLQVASSTQRAAAAPPHSTLRMHPACPGEARVLRYRRRPAPFRHRAGSSGRASRQVALSATQTCVLCIRKKVPPHTQSTSRIVRTTRKR